MTRYSVQLRDQTFVKGCWFLPFARNMSKNISKNIRSKCSQKLLDHVKQSTTDARERVFYHLILEWVGMANLPELIFPRRNCAVGMKLCICNNYHKDFLFSSKNLHGCADVSIFLLISAKIGILRHLLNWLHPSLDQNMTLLILTVQICS